MISQDALYGGNDGTYSSSSSLTSSILPSMDLSEVLSHLQQQSNASDMKTTTSWNWSSSMESGLRASQSGFSISAGHETMDGSSASSPRQRHAFQSNPVFDNRYIPGSQPQDQELDAGHPPSPGCSKKSQQASHQLPPFLDGLRRTLLRSASSSDLWNSQWLWLFLYFSFNLLLTLSNKSVLIGFPYPYTLTGLHTLCSTIGCYFLRSRGVYISKPLSKGDQAVLVAFSALYAVNIIVSNVSLQLVTVPFHQVVRAATPIFIIALSTLLLNEHTRKLKLLSLSPVILGVIIATYGDYYFTLSGFFFTLFGTFLAALKTIYTNVLQSSTKPRNLYPSGSLGTLYPQHSIWQTLLTPPSLGIHPLDLLMRMSPLAFIQCVLYAHLSGELDRVRQLSYPRPFFPLDIVGFKSLTSNCTSLGSSAVDLPPTSGLSRQSLPLIVNGCIAFGLNVVSLTANGKIGALSMTVAANVKQVLTILFAVILFDLTITPANALGISITLLGGAWYAWGEYVEKQSQKGLRGETHRKEILSLKIRM